MGDGGLGAGCALGEYFTKYPNFKKSQHNMYLGSNYKFLKEKLVIRSNIEILEVKNIYKFIAKQLKEQKIIGLFQGKMEYGPRSLGNRSIICSPKNIKINEILNEKLQRSDFMPFAPCVLAEDFKIFFNSKQSVEEFQFMTFTCETKKICEDLAPAIVHLDKTARPQSVYQNKNKFLHKLLSEFKKETGIGMLINTSFNIHEEPIVESHQDAVKSFEEGNLDFLVLEDKILKLKK
jgi:carbamoyltransferase